jgi:hypothetical protein
VGLNGLPASVYPTFVPPPYMTTITIPAARGHYTGWIDSYLTLPDYLGIAGQGFSQLQVATVPPHFPTS